MAEKAISRRSFLKRVGAGAVAVGLASFEPFRVSGQPVTLRITQWQHFVPAYDKWFDPFAKAWGQNRNPPVNVQVEHISFADIIPRAKAIVAAQSGPDLFGFLSPPSQFINDVIDHKDIVETMTAKHGPITELVKKSTLNPKNDKWFGFSNMWTIDPVDIHKDIWTAIDKSNGPSSLQELLAAGDAIRAKFPNVQIPIGIGYSQDIDSNMAMRALLWSFGGSIQDENEQVVLNSPETLDALKFGIDLFQRASPAVLSWNAASNNQAFNAKATSLILNSISAYRAAQINPALSAVADNTFFTGALPGPKGRFASEHVMHIYVIWKFAQQQSLAQEFLTFLMDNQGPNGFAAPAGTEGAATIGGGPAKGDVLNSKLYNTSSFLGALADPNLPTAQKQRAGWEWLKQQFENDPFSHKPSDPAQTQKLQPLFSGVEEPLPDGTVKLGWSTNVGRPGFANPAISQIFDEFVLTDMFATAATGVRSPQQALDAANRQVKLIFNDWRQRGLVGGDPSKDK